MQPWVLPTVIAVVVGALLLLGLLIFFCRRAAEMAGPRTTRRWGSNIHETTQHLLRDQALDRFVLFMLNFTSLCWNLEHNIIHTDRGLVLLRRGLNILSVFLGLFAIGVVDELWLNWCCYPDNTSLEDLKEGLCRNDNSTIHNSTNVKLSCTSMETWEWIVNLCFIGSVFLSLAIHIYLSYNFTHNVRSGVEGSYTGTIDAINSHQASFPPEAISRMKKFTHFSFMHHSPSNGTFTPHEINLHRLVTLFFDPFAILFGLPQIVLSRSDLALANMANLAAMVGTWLLYSEWAVPRWEKTCCYYDASTRSGSFGACNDPTAQIAKDPFREPCSGLSLEMIIIASFGVAEVAVSIGIWLYSVVLFEYILHNQTIATLKKLHVVALTHSEDTDKFHLFHPPPPYGTPNP